MFGGTSVAAPIIAGIYGANGNGLDIGARSLYADPSALWDIAVGHNGSCTPSYLCKAGVGYDGPTGLGTPNGNAAF